MVLPSPSQEPVIELPTHGLVRWSLPLRWVLGYLNSPAPHYAPAIAFNAFIAIFPITLGLVALLVLTSPGKLVTREVEHIILEAFPVGTRADIGHLIYSAVKHPKTLGILYLLAMLWSSSALFSCIGGALNALHGVTGRHVIKQRLMGLRMTPVLLGTIVFLVALETVTDRLPKTPIIGMAAAGIVLTFLIAFIYRTAPNTHVPIRQALPGAFLAALAIETVTLAFPLYSSLSTQISTLGRGLAIALVLLGWLYLVAHILLLGAYFNSYGPARRSHPSHARSS
jgi:membrane protein